MASGHLVSVLQCLRRLGAGPPGAVPTDGDLLRRFVASRDGDAFAALVSRHGPMVYGVCRRLLRHTQDAEDAFQATFLILSRKAASVRRGQALAAWLHEVARRVAVRARGGDLRRRARERQVPEMKPHEPLDPVTLEELRAVLDEELAGLPAKYRTALVLCDLEGRTHQQAARELGCPPGSVSGRLARARALLRGRLARRGLALSGAALAAVLTDRASAAVPALLAVAAVRAATATTAAVSANVAALAEKGIREMGMSKLKGGLALLLAVSLLAGAGVLARQTGEAGPPAGKPEPPAAVRPGGNGPAREDAPRAAVDRYGDPLPAGALLRLGTVRLRHAVMTACAAFTPDGRSVIVSDADGHLVFWDVATGKEVRRLRDGNDVLYALAVSPDGKTLAAGGWGRLTFYDLSTFARTARWPVENDAVKQIALTADGKTAAVCYQGAMIDLYDPATGKQLHRLEGHLGNVASIDLSPDGKTLASGSWQDPNLRLWDTATGKPLRQIAAGGQDVLAVAFVPDGKALASAGNGTTIRFWDPATGRKLRDGDARSHGVTELHYLPDGKALAGFSGMKVRLWDAATGKSLREFEGKPRNMGHLAVAPDGKTIATSWGGPHTFDLWDVATGKLLHAFAGHRERVAAVAFAADGRTLFSAAGLTGDAVYEWDLMSGRVRREVGEGPNSANDLTLTPDGRSLAACGYNDNTTRLWDLATGKELRRFKGHANVPMSVSLSADGATLATGSYYDQTLRLWDAATGKESRSIPLNQDSPCPAVLSPDGKVVATGGYRDGTVRLWGAATGKVVRELATPHRPALTVAFAPDGRTLATGGVLGPVCLWDAATGKQVRRFEDAGGWVARVAFSPDGRTLASGGHDNAVTLWELTGGRARAVFTGHTGAVHALAFAPDGRRLASGGDDTTVLVWDVGGRPPGGAEFTPEALDALWDDLGGADPVKAHRAVWALAGAPDQSVPLLRRHIAPAAAPPADTRQKVARLLPDLDRDDFAVRQKAAAELEKLGPPAEPLLRQALQGDLSPEARRRLERLLDSVEGACEGEWLRDVRALEVLEHIGTPEARRLVEAWAGGEPGARRTREAKATLESLNRRAGSP
jgi:RNA polymerase sigma factor (sigma-70 family)